MECQSIRNQILALEEPAKPPRELAVHLDCCESCRAWLRKLSQMEQALIQLPVPQSEGAGKAAVLERIRLAAPAMATASGTNHKPVTHARPMPLDLESDLPKKRFNLKTFTAKFWPVGLIAATLLIGAIAWMNLREQKPEVAQAPPSDPLLESVVQLNVELAKARTANERVEVLTRLANELNQEMRDIARADSTGENMQALEQMYRRVVLQGLMAQAKMIERSKREAVLGKIADSLAQAGDRADQTAAESPEHSAVRLREVAATAREGTKQIRALIKEASL